jgi:hypothetical protein
MTSTILVAEISDGAIMVFLESVEMVPDADSDVSGSGRRSDGPQAE